MENKYAISTFSFLSYKVTNAISTVSFLSYIFRVPIYTPRRWLLMAWNKYVCLQMNRNRQNSAILFVGVAIEKLQTALHRGFFL